MHACMYVIHNHFLCRVSMPGRCHVFRRLAELALYTESFHDFSLDYFYRGISHTIGGLAHTIVEGNYLFKAKYRHPLIALLGSLHFGHTTFFRFSCTACNFLPGLSNRSGNLSIISEVGIGIFPLRNQ